MHVNIFFNVQNPASIPDTPGVPWDYFGSHCSSETGPVVPMLCCITNNYFSSFLQNPDDADALKKLLAMCITQTWRIERLAFDKPEPFPVS